MIEMKDRKEREAREAAERKADKGKELELERMQCGLSVPKKGGEDMERTMVRSLPLIPDFDEQKVEKWFPYFEKTSRKFKWSPERWVGVVASNLKGKVLEAYNNMRSLRQTSYGLSN